jgi:hypothetical protein
LPCDFCAPHPQLVAHCIKVYAPSTESRGRIAGTQASQSTPTVSQLAAAFESQYPGWTPAQVLDACNQYNKQWLQLPATSFSEQYNRQQQLQWQQAPSSSQPVYKEDDGRYTEDDMEDVEYGEPIASSGTQNTVLMGDAFGLPMLLAAATALSERDNENYRMTTIGATVDTEMLPLSSFTVRGQPTRYSETEMTINYPLALQEKILTLMSKLYPLLDKLGVNGAGFSFGYDILPEAFILEDHDDHNIFTGSFRVFC